MSAGCEEELAGVVKSLLAQGIDVSALAGSGLKALHMAVYYCAGPGGCQGPKRRPVRRRVGLGRCCELSGHGTGGFCTWPSINMAV